MMTKTEPEKRRMSEVRAYYGGGYSEVMDKAAFAAAGRISDFSGMGCCDGERDHGWRCETEIEVMRIHNKLKAAGFRVEVREGLS